MRLSSSMLSDYKLDEDFLEDFYITPYPQPYYPTSSTPTPYTPFYPTHHLTPSTLHPCYLTPTSTTLHRLYIPTAPTPFPFYHTPYTLISYHVISVLLYQSQILNNSTICHDHTLSESKFIITLRYITLSHLINIETHNSKPVNQSSRTS